MSTVLAGGMPTTHEEFLALAAQDDQPMKVSVCKFCGKGGLQWLKYGDPTEKPKWVLVEMVNGRLQRHTCEQAKSFFSKAHY